MRRLQDPARALSRVLLVLFALLVVLVPAQGALAHEGDDTEEVPVEDSSVSSPAGPAHAGSHLESSWPRDGVMLWVPPKEGRLTFIEPVKASTLTVTLSRTDGGLLVEDEVVRLTSGESVTEVLLRLPPLRPGSYELLWSVTAASNAQFEGSVGFGLEPPIAAVGGQNHRHGESHLYEDTPGQFALRVLFVTAVAFLFAAVRRAKLVPGKGALDRLLLRVGAGVLLLATLLAGVVDVTKWVDEYHDKPFAAIAASPVLTILVPVLAFVVFVAIRPIPSPLVFWCGVSALAAYAGLSHAVQTELGVGFFAVFTVLLVSLALLWAEMLRMCVTSFASGPLQVPVTRRLTLAVAVLALLSSSFLMLLLHANTLDLQMAFVRDFRARSALSTLLVAAVLPYAFLVTGSRRSRLFALLFASVVVVASSLLAWMPPPAAGL